MATHPISEYPCGRKECETCAWLNAERAYIDRRTAADDCDIDSLHEAQLYWDAPHGADAGWWLRYRDDRGTEQGIEIDGAEDATTEELADAVEASAHWLPPNGEITIIRHGERRGAIRLTDGAVSGWEAR
jgi:hypothetical protein